MERGYRESIGFKDTVEAVVFDKDGYVKQLHYGEDLITNAGLAAVSAIMASDVAGSNRFDWIAIGSGSTAASATDVALDAEHERANASGTQVTTTKNNDTAQFIFIFSSGNPTGLGGASTGTQAIVESGLFNASSGPTLLCRQTFGALNIDWDSGDSLQITWKIQIQG